MYDFHNKYMETKSRNGLKLLFTDTDSVCYNICTDDIYTDWIYDKPLLHVSEYPPDHTLHYTANKK